MNFGPWEFVMDMALMSLLLFVAQFIRSRVKIVQNLYLPSSLIAGFLGLGLSKQGLGVLPFSDQISSYAYLGIVILFASLFIGNENKESFKKVVNEVGDTFTLNLAAEIGQFGFALFAGTIIITRFFPEVNQAFSILMPAGFVGGLLLINIATKKGYTRLVKSMGQLPKSMQTGLVPKEERTVMGDNTVNPMSIDPLSWHILLVLVATAGGFYVQGWLKIVFPGITLPMFSLSMLAGIVVQYVLKFVKMDGYVDKRIMTRIGSSVTDYLVAFGVASIQLSIVIKYAVPIMIMLACGLFFAVFFVFFIGRKLFHNYWFERSIFIYGWSTGVVAMGVTLLRIVDPEFRSKTLEDYGMAYVFISFVELFIVSITPIYVLKSGGSAMMAGIVMIAIAVALWVATAVKYGVHKGSMSDLRDGEAEVINQYDEVAS